MDLVTSILGGTFIAVVSGAIGKYIGSNGKMSEKHCEEKRLACQQLITERIDNLGSKIDSLQNWLKQDN